ncbi:hypothetical protein F383_34445 [Gossypium arboreum]|uniref:Uncharacterized protein n=1 Tax=Gossypium arboreum TaxID=29729 RepID=A0A0B0PT95_GOSAR|nr:hypothetical protein F383_34445 [Gossypium arboreum]
MGVWIGSCGLS